MRTVVRAARRLLVGGAICALVGFSVDARADDLTIEQCVAANESAQGLRREGKLRAARVQLLICDAKNCPGPVRDDCAERLKDVERAAPTIVFAAQEPAGIALGAVQITMDGARLADHLDGSALVVDPGEHTFKFVADGHTTVSRRLVLREGVKGRKEVVTLEPSTPHGEREPIGAPVVVKPEEARPKDSAPGGPPSVETSQSYWTERRVLGVVIGAVGIAGVGVGGVLGLSAKSDDDKAAGETGSARHTDSVSAVGAGNVATVVVAVGTAVAIAGVVLWLTAPRAATQVGTNGTEIIVRGRF